MTLTDHNRGSVSALALLLSLAGSATLGAQPNQTFIDTVDVQVVEVDVVVTDRKGRPVKDLAREDFELYVDGQPVEITNFYESSIYVEEPTGRRNKERPAVRNEATPGATVEGPLTVVFYLDDPNIFPSHRTRLLRRLEHAVAPWRSMEARFMLARFDHRLEVLVPPTPDLDAILESAAAVPKGSPRAIQNVEGARRFAIRSLIASHEACLIRACRPCQDNWGELLSLARQYADNRATNTAIAVDGLADLVTTLAGAPGKKAVVYVTDGLPQRPGISVLDYLGNQLCRDLRPTAPSEAMAEIAQYDESRRFNRIAAHANANRVTFFALDAAGLRDTTPDISLGDRTTAPSSRNLSLRNMNAQSGLHIVASETGGKALLNANDLALLLDGVSAHLAVSYSLGFAATERKPGEIRQLQVALARNAAKGRTVEYRRSYRDKSVDERLAERLLSVAYLGSAENPLQARVGFGATQPLEKNVHELAVGVDVPAETILALPFRGQETGQLRLWLLAVKEDDGTRTAVRQQSLLVGGGSGVAVIDGAYRFEVAMNLPAGSYQVAVGVRDETTGVTSLIREPVSVPTPEAGAAAN